MVYHLTYIHGIYVVHHGISMDIRSFLKPDFAVFQCCWSHSTHTRVWVIKSVLFHAPPWQLPGERAAHRRLNPTAANLSPLSLAAVVTEAVAAVLLLSFRFVVLLLATILILVKDWC
jgi:hypothetical protein